MTDSVPPVFENENPLVNFSPEEMIGWLRKYGFSNLAFGFLYVPEQSIFIGAFCKKEKVQRINQLSDSTSSQSFVAFPFDSRSRAGFSIPNFPEDSLSATNQSGSNGIQPNKPNHVEEHQAEYQNLVSKGIEKIKSGELKKIVLGRSVTYPFPPENLSKWVSDLLLAYPQSNLSLMNLPDLGFWVSVSPEILLERNEEGSQLRTMALAGTMRVNTATSWTNKEKAEQGFVEEFIRQKVKSADLVLIEELGPFPAAAGNVIHLKTEFKIQSSQSSDFDRLAQMLHPTPAVCGTSQQSALDWISILEGFDREMYCGFAGIRKPGFSRLAVLLRIGKINNNSITLYVGAGITHDSIPQKEWVETEEKVKTLRKFL